MTFYTDMAALANSFFSGEMFSDAVLQRVNQQAAAYNPVTGTVGGGGITTTSVAIRAVAKEILIRSVTGETIAQTEITLNLKPEVNDLIVMGSLTYMVKTTMTVAPDGNPILYRAVVTQ